MKHGAPLQRRTPLRADPLKVQAFVDRGRKASKPKPRAVSPASPAQRAHVKGRGCVVCAATPVDPAHLIDRSLCPTGADDALATVPLCRTHHRDFDEGRLSLLEHLEPIIGREELAYAVLRFGLISTLERVTNQRWRPVSEEMAA